MQHGFTSTRKDITLAREDMDTRVFSGYVVRDPDVKNVGQKQTLLASFSVATNDRAGGVVFSECTAWGKTAEVVEKIIQKGTYAIFRSRQRDNTWEQDGQKRKKRVDVIDFINVVKGGVPSGDIQGQPSRPSETYTQGTGNPLKEDDLPF